MPNIEPPACEKQLYHLPYERATNAGQKSYLQQPVGLQTTLYTAYNATRIALITTMHSASENAVNKLLVVELRAINKPIWSLQRNNNFRNTEST